MWKEKGYLNKDNLKEIQDIVDSAEVPADVGKLPGIIDNFTFDGFTADELKNFYLLFAIYSLQGILPRNHHECLRKFVIACNYLCNRVLTAEDMKICDNYLLQFCTSFERIFGKQAVTPNIHLHCHLVECMKDYGPIYSFWLFSFERYNGMLGNIPTNRKSIEIQFMNRFTRESILVTHKLPDMFQEQFTPLVQSVSSVYADRGALSEVSYFDYVPFIRLSSKFTNYSSVDWSINNLKGISFKCKDKYTLTDREFRNIKDIYHKLYPDLHTESHFISLSCWKSKICFVNKEVYGSQRSRSHRSSYITAFWCGDGGNVQSYEDMYLYARPGRICSFISHLIYVNNEPKQHIFALVQWFLPVVDELRFKFGKPVEVWSSDLLEMEKGASFIPVQRIKSKFVHIKFQYRSKNVMAVLPRNRFTSI